MRVDFKVLDQSDEINEKLFYANETFFEIQFVS